MPFGLEESKWMIFILFLKVKCPMLIKFMYDLNIIKILIYLYLKENIEFIWFVNLHHLFKWFIIYQIK